MGLQPKLTCPAPLGPCPNRPAPQPAFASAFFLHTFPGTSPPPFVPGWMRGAGAGELSLLLLPPAEPRRASRGPTHSYKNGPGGKRGHRQAERKATRLLIPLPRPLWGISGQMLPPQAAREPRVYSPDAHRRCSSRFTEGEAERREAKGCPEMAEGVCRRGSLRRRLAESGQRDRA